MPFSSIVLPQTVSRPQVVLARIRFRITRDGEVSPGRKYLRMTQSIHAGSQLYVGLEALDGEYTPWVDLPLQLLTDQADWLVVVEDLTAPRRADGQLLQIPGAGTYTINISTGAGGATEPAALGALVRLDGLPGSREVVVVERPPSGDWRVAGHGVSGADGVLALDLDVTEGSLFAVGLDDFGTAFSPGLSVEVGRRIRPSVFAGVLYEITEPGVLPATEPAWWPITSEGSRELGTARAEAVRYYRPLAHGPVTAEPS
jgi:hypothetical protein